MSEREVAGNTASLVELAAENRRKLMFLRNRARGDIAKSPLLRMAGIDDLVDDLLRQLDAQAALIQELAAEVSR